jgi:hypothetical protein
MLIILKIYIDSLFYVHILNLKMELNLNNLVRNYHLTQCSESDIQENTEYGISDISKSGKIQKKKNELSQYYSQSRRDSYDLSSSPHAKLILFKFNHLSNDMYKLNEYYITPYGKISII